MELFAYIESFLTVVMLSTWQDIPWIWPCGTMLPWGYKVWAAYNREVKTMWLCQSKNTVAYKHELSHHAWFYMLSQEEINKYTVAWEASKKIWSQVFARDYSMQSVWEGFADDMSYVCAKMYEDRASTPNERMVRCKRLQIIKVIVLRLSKLAKKKNGV